MNIDKKVTACLTGHRPKKLPWGYNENSGECLRFKDKLRELFLDMVNKGTKNFLVGMAQGFDMIGAEVLQKLRDEEGVDIKIIAVIPCLNQADIWGVSYKQKYNHLVNKCDDKVVLSDKYYAGCMMDRNKFMVDNSSIVLACFDGSSGGTGNTVNYARKNNVQVITIYP